MHQPRERDVAAAGFADAVVRSMQPLERRVHAGLVDARPDRFGELVALFEGEVVVMHMLRMVRAVARGPLDAGQRDTARAIYDRGA